ncbi:hypothetical protein BGZ65_011902, partial [Modicella reniformis]
MDNPQKDIPQSPQQQEQQQQQKSPRPTMVHSTHSNLETFDQATREQRQHHPDNSAKSIAQDNTKRSVELEQINSAVQLDRDVQRSRRTADESQQKTSGNTRSGSWTGSPQELPYV